MCRIQRSCCPESIKSSALQGCLTMRGEKSDTAEAFTLKRSDLPMVLLVCQIEQLAIVSARWCPSWTHCNAVHKVPLNYTRHFHRQTITSQPRIALFAISHSL